MLHQLRQVFRRYADHHVALAKPGFALIDEMGNTIGQLESVTWASGRVILRGWTEAQQVALVVEGTRTAVTPSQPRIDVTGARPDIGTQTPGFEIEVLHHPGRALFSVEMGDFRYLSVLPDFTAAEIRAARRRWILPFAWVLIRAAPALADWLFTRSARSRARLKLAFGFTDETRLAGMATALFADMPGPDTDTETETVPNPAGLAETAITIVLPVYNAFELLQEALDRVAAHTDLPWHLIAVEDRSTDAQVRPWLRERAAALNAGAPGRVTLLENETNLGFIRSVNRAFALAIERGDHVVLLNSDALVPEGWASRLIRPLLAHDDVASVTPMSNDAEIFTVPVICHREHLHPGEADRIDALARSFHPDAELTVAPTGVGFCMAMHIDRLKQEPQFDTGFGRGYGEEVDWCQKVRARGGRHLGLPGLFVEHRGGMSFGSAEKLKLVQANNAVIAKRYRDYDREVQDFIRHDPLATPRLALGLAFAAGRAGDRPVSLYMAHALGGGAENYLQHRIAADLDSDAGGAGVALVLRVGGAHRWQLELYGPGGMTRGVTHDFGFVQRLLAPFPALRIVYSNGVGDPDPAALPDRLLDLVRSDADRVEVLFHDFFPLSPRYTLLDGDGRFKGVPVPGQNEKAHRIRRPGGAWVSLAAWRAAWGRLIAAAEEVVVFSGDSRAHVLAAYPQAEAALQLRPHALIVTPDRVPAPAADARPVIGVLGNIGHQKGAGVVAALSEGLAVSDAADLVLVGNIDPAYALARGTVVHGDYRPADIPDLVRRYRITTWFIPSIWPETFSYTTHEALATGLPVWSFDLGAQAEAIDRAVAQGAPGGTIALPDNPPPGAPLPDAVTATLVRNRQVEPA